MTRRTQMKVYRFMDGFTGYAAPALLFVSMVLAYEGRLATATFAAVWAVALVQMFSRLELDQLRRDQARSYMAQRALANGYAELVQQEEKRHGESE